MQRYCFNFSKYHYATFLSQECPRFVLKTKFGKYGKTNTTWQYIVLLDIFHFNGHKLGSLCQTSPISFLCRKSNSESGRKEKTSARSYTIGFYPQTIKHNKQCQMNLGLSIPPQHMHLLALYTNQALLWDLHLVLYQSRWQTEHSVMDLEVVFP